jgi:hypothetical protein
MLTWDVDLFTDHVDGDKQNNDPHNLVPCCVRCNNNRARIRMVACRRGHDLSDENTYTFPDGRRQCRICRRRARRTWVGRNVEYEKPRRPQARSVLAEKRIARFIELGGTWEAICQIAAESKVDRESVVTHLRTHRVKLPDGRVESATRGSVVRWQRARLNAAGVKQSEESA